MNDLLNLALSALAGGGLAALVTWSIAQRRIAVENVTTERRKWREKIRALALLAHEAFLEGDETQLERLRCEFRARLNPFDLQDRKLLSCMEVGEDPASNTGRSQEFDERIGLLLKHDWERAKLEAGFFLGRWTIEPRRWGVDWTTGKAGERRAANGLRWYEKHKVRPVRMLVLIVFLDAALAITCLAAALRIASG